eukprot:9572021-Alexandrium_andersonii.AAC.1
MRLRSQRTAVPRREHAGPWPRLAIACVRHCRWRGPSQADDDIAPLAAVVSAHACLRAGGPDRARGGRAE